MRIRNAFLPFLASSLAFGMYLAIGRRYFDSFLLELGSIHLPRPGHAYFLMLWLLFGSVATAFGTMALARIASSGGIADAVLRRWNGVSDHTWMIATALLALLIPFAIRWYVLRNAPVTDDESAYRFMAQLLAHGKLRADSPAMKMFFDHIFMVNNGHLYAQYFLGWPALMVPGVWIGYTGIMNPLYCALTAIPMFLIVRSLFGSSWAKLGTVLFLTSPIVMANAATELSHTTCLMALAWMTWFFLRSREDPAWRLHAGLAVSFSLAFFIRPYTAVAAGSPVLLWWLTSLFQVKGRARSVPAVSFLVPAIAFAALFLSVNKVQNGSFFMPSYATAEAYRSEPGSYFQMAQERLQAQITQEGLQAEDFLPGPHPERITLLRVMEYVLSNAGIGLIRYNAAFLGWPISLFFLFFAGSRKSVRLFWYSFAGLFIFNSFHWSAGIDTFAPVKYTEMSLPAIVLTIAGIKNMTVWLSRFEDKAPGAYRLSRLPAACVAVLVIFSLAGYVPVRLRTLHRAAENINVPRDTVAALSLQDAVIFCPFPCTPLSMSEPVRHFVFWRPNNDPDLANDPLWVNDLGKEENAELMEHFPDRSGYVMRWTEDYELFLIPLAEYSDQDAL